MGPQHPEGGKSGSQLPATKKRNLFPPELGPQHPEGGKSGSRATRYTKGPVLGVHNTHLSSPIILKPVERCFHPEAGNKIVPKGEKEFQSAGILENEGIKGKSMEICRVERI